MNIDERLKFRECSAREKDGDRPSTRELALVRRTPLRVLGSQLKDICRVVLNGVQFILTQTTLSPRSFTMAEGDSRRRRITLANVYELVRLGKF
jgi:hypothetical protein